MTINGLWSLLKANYQCHRTGVDDPNGNKKYPLVKPIYAGQDLETILRDAILCIDLSRWITEADQQGKQQLAQMKSIIGHGDKQNINNIKSKSPGPQQQQQHWSTKFREQIESGDFIILTIFRRIVFCLLMGCRTLIGILDSRRISKDKNARGYDGFRFSKKLYNQVKQLFKCFSLPCYEAPNEAEQLCGQIQRKLDSKFKNLKFSFKISYVDTNDGDALLYGATKIIKGLKAKWNPSEVVAQVFEVDMEEGQDQVPGSGRTMGDDNYSTGKNHDSDNPQQVQTDNDISKLNNNFKKESATDTLKRLLNRKEVRIINSSCQAAQQVVNSDHIVAPRKLSFHDSETEVTQPIQNDAVKPKSETVPESNLRSERIISDPISSQDDNITSLTENQIQNYQQFNFPLSTLSRYEYAFIGTVSGSDFANDGVAKGIGIVKALKQIAHLRFNTNEEQIRNIRKERVKVKNKRDREMKKLGKKKTQKDSTVLETIKSKEVLQIEESSPHRQRPEKFSRFTPQKSSPGNQVSPDRYSTGSDNNLNIQSPELGSDDGLDTVDLRKTATKLSESPLSSSSLNLIQLESSNHDANWHHLDTITRELQTSDEALAYYRTKYLPQSKNILRDAILHYDIDSCATGSQSDPHHLAYQVYEKVYLQDIDLDNQIQSMDSDFNLDQLTRPVKDFDIKTLVEILGQDTFTTMNSLKELYGEMWFRRKRYATNDELQHSLSQFKSESKAYRNSMKISTKLNLKRQESMQNVSQSEHENGVESISQSNSQATDSSKSKISYNLGTPILPLEISKVTEFGQQYRVKVKFNRVNINLLNAAAASGNSNNVDLSSQEYQHEQILIRKSLLRECKDDFAQDLKNFESAEKLKHDEKIRKVQEKEEKAQQRQLKKELKMNKTCPETVSTGDKKSKPKGRAKAASLLNLGNYHRLDRFMTPSQQSTPRSQQTRNTETGQSQTNQVNQLQVIKKRLQKAITFGGVAVTQQSNLNHNGNIGTLTSLTQQGQNLSLNSDTPSINSNSINIMTQGQGQQSNLLQGSTRFSNTTTPVLSTPQLTPTVTVTGCSIPHSCISATKRPSSVILEDLRKATANHSTGSGTRGSFKNSLSSNVNVLTTIERRKSDSNVIIGNTTNNHNGIAKGREGSSFSLLSHGDTNSNCGVISRFSSSNSISINGFRNNSGLSLDNDSDHSIRQPQFIQDDNTNSTGLQLGTPLKKRKSDNDIDLQDYSCIDPGRQGRESNLNTPIIRADTVTDNDVNDINGATKNTNSNGKTSKSFVTISESDNLNHSHEQNQDLKDSDGFNKPPDHNESSSESSVIEMDKNQVINIETSEENSK